MAYMPCSMLGHTALGVCLLLLDTLGHTPDAQPSPGHGGLGAYGTFNGQLHMNGTEKAMKAMWRQAQLEHSGGSTPDPIPGCRL